MYKVQQTIFLKPVINQKWIIKNENKSILGLYREIYNYFPDEERTFLDEISTRIEHDIKKIKIPTSYKKLLGRIILEQYKGLYNSISEGELEKYFYHVRQNFLKAIAEQLINAISNDKTINNKPKVYLNYSDSIKEELYDIEKYFLTAFENVITSSLIITYFIKKSDFSIFLTENEIIENSINEIAVKENFKGGLFSIGNANGEPVPEFLFGVLKNLILEKFSTLNKRDEKELYRAAVKRLKESNILQEKLEKESIQFKQIWALNNLYAELFLIQNNKYQANNYFSLGDVAYCENNFLDALMFMRKHFEKEYTRKEFKSLLTSDASYVERFNFKGDISEYQQILHYLMKEKIIKKTKIHEITKERFLFNGILENRELNTIQKQFNSQKMDMYSKLYQDLVSKFKN